jgi:hypothetical protein
MLAPAPPINLSDRFRLSIVGLCGVLAVLASRQPAVSELLMLVWRRLRRMSVQFSALADRFRAGKLRVASAAPNRTACRAASRAPSSPPSARLPSRPAGWLFRMMPEVDGDGYHVASYRAQVAAFRSQLTYLLNDPETLALIEATPKQAARLLRPLCHLLGIESVPALLRKPAADRAPPAPAPAAGGPATPSPPDNSQTMPMAAGVVVVPDRCESGPN